MTANFPLDGIYLIVGLSGSGKSVLLDHLAHTLKKHFDYAIGFTGTRFAGSLSFIPEEFVYPSFRPELMTKILAKQEHGVRNGEKVRCAVFLDDVLGDSELKFYGRLWEKLASSARHYLMTIFVTTQYAFAVPPIIRRNALAVFITSAPCEEDVSVLFKEFGRRITKEAFRKILDRATTGYSSLYINPVGRSAAETYRAIQAPPRVPKFLLEPK